MAKFREISSGSVYEFLSAYDIEQMRKHPDYTEVVEATPVPVVKEFKELPKQ